MKKKPVKKRPIREFFSLMNAKKQEFGMMMLLDALFIIIILNLNFLSKWLSTKYFMQIQSAPFWFQTTSFYIMMTAIFITIILTYSLIKYTVLNYLQDIFKKKTLKFNKIRSFTKSNAINLTFTGIMIAAYIMSTSVYIKKALAAGASDPFLVIFTIIGITGFAAIMFLYLFTYLNISGIVFLKENKPLKAVKRTFYETLNTKNYKPYWPIFKIAGTTGLILLIIHILVKTFILTDVFSYLKYYGYYRIFLIAYGSLTYYIILSFYRINLYQNHAMAHKTR